MSFFPGSPTPSGGPAPLDRRSLHDHWRALTVFGAVSTVLGILALALTVSATIASVLMIGVLMIVAGATEIAIGVRVRSWQRFIAWEVAGLLYMVAGLFAVLAPEVATVVLTLLLGAGLIATGALRLIFGLQVGSTTKRGSVLLSGAVTVLLGLFIVLGWPGNSPFILGTLLGIDLVFNGIAWMAFGWQARHPA